MTDKTRETRHVERALPPEEHAPNNSGIMAQPEHIPSEFSFLLPKDQAPNNFSNTPLRGRIRLHEEPSRKERRSPEKPSLHDAIDTLVAEMVRAEPDLLREDAREVIRQTVHDLLKDAGKVA